MAWFWQCKPASIKTIEQARRQRTERIAYQVYQNRCLLNRPGNEQSDWDTARRIIRNLLRRLLFAAHCRLIGLEKTVWEPLDAWAQRQALLSLIGNAGIILAVASYIASEKLRRDAEVRNAWH